MVAETEKLTNSEKKIEKITEEIRRIKNDNKKFDEAKKLENTWKELWQSIDRDLPTLSWINRSLDSRLESVRSDLLQRKSELENTAKENERRTKHNTRIQVIQEQTNAFLLELAEFQDVLAKQDALLSNLEILKKPSVQTDFLPIRSKIL